MDEPVKPPRDDTDMYVIAADIGHWAVLVVVVFAVVYLAGIHSLNGDSVTAILGGIVGHSGTYASLRRTGN